MDVLATLALIALFVCLLTGLLTWWQNDKRRRRAAQWAREREAFRAAERQLDIDMGLKPREYDD